MKKSKHIRLIKSYINFIGKSKLTLSSMSDLCVNIRFWYWHLQIGKKFSSFSWDRNGYFTSIGLKGVSKIEVYEFFGLF